MADNLDMSLIQQRNERMSEDSSTIITNSTAENIIVYGSKRETDSGNYDKSWYILHPGETTPSNWGFEGIFVPKDRKLEQENNQPTQGPIAVKYPVSKSVTITQNGDEYLENGEHNIGIFHQTEINWPVPEFSSENCKNMTKHMYQIQD